MPRGERDIPQPQESRRDHNQREFQRLAEFGGNLEKATLLVNGLVQEVAREQGYKDDFPYGMGLRDERVLGGKFNKFASQNGVLSEAFVEVYKNLDMTRDRGYRAEDDTRFVTNVGSLIYVANPAERRYGGVARRDGVQTWDLAELEDNPKVMERFKRDIKGDLTQALDDTRNAEGILAAERRRYEQVMDFIEDSNNPDAYRPNPRFDS